jgi:hypothetical protein
VKLKTTATGNVILVILESLLLICVFSMGRQFWDMLYMYSNFLFKISIFIYAIFMMNLFGLISSNNIYILFC